LIGEKKRDILKMIFKLQGEECILNAYNDSYDVIIRGKLYVGYNDSNKISLYLDNYVGSIDLEKGILYDMLMDGTPIEQEYYFEGRVYQREDDQLIGRDGHVIAYLDTEWVWLVDYKTEGVLV